MNKRARFLLTCGGLLALALFAGQAWLGAQSTGTVAPVEKRQFFDDNGQPLSGGLIYTYAAGTSTSQLVYQDAALATPHANPVVLDSAGRATIFFAQQAYKVVVANSAAVQLYTVDNVQSTAYSAAQATINETCSVRMTLTSGTPVTDSDVTSATTVYVTPYQGNKCALYDGTNWNVRTITELSLSLGSDAANTNYDLFIYDNAGTPTLQRVAWSNNTTRATALTTQDGVYARVSATTARYLGTYRTTNIAGRVEDSAKWRYLWNYYHQKPRPLRRQESTATWTYTTAAYRQVNGSTQNHVGVVVGLAEVPLNLYAQATAVSSTTNVEFRVGVGAGDQNTTSTSCSTGLTTMTAPTNNFSAVARCSLMAPVGFTSWLWLEYSVASGTTTWNGTGGGADFFSGLYGTLFGG